MSDAHTFDSAVRCVLGIEGGVLTNDQYDPGGETKFGISKRYHPAVDIAILTRADAIAIYEKEYWLAAGCDRMPWAWALSVFDAAVNQGVSTSLHLAQKALGVQQDGKLGSLTLAAMQRADALDRLADFFALRCVAYAESPNADRYGHGWFRRAFVVHAAALA